MMTRGNISEMLSKLEKKFPKTDYPQLYLEGKIPFSYLDKDAFVSYSLNNKIMPADVMFKHDALYSEVKTAVTDPNLPVANAVIAK